MTEIDTLIFRTSSATLGQDGEITWYPTIYAYYEPHTDTVWLVDDNVHTVVHELCERDMLMLFGHTPIQGTLVSHIMSPFKAARWGKWRTWGLKS